MNDTSSTSATVSSINKDPITWHGSNVSMGQVVRAIEELRFKHQRGSTRTSVATLVIVTKSEEELKIADTVIEHLGERHPARVITVLNPPEAAEGSDQVNAEVILHSGHAEGHPIWSDEIRLTVSGGPARHTASLLRPLQISDLPIVVWYVKGLPSIGDPLLKAATAVMVDSKTLLGSDSGEPEMYRIFEKIHQLSNQITVIDLSWNRLRPWRRLLSSQFEGQNLRKFLYNVTHIEISGKLGPRTLLAGWLGSRLGLKRTNMSLYDQRHVEISLHCKCSLDHPNGISSLTHTTNNFFSNPQSENIENLVSDHISSGFFSVKRLGDNHLIEAEVSVLHGPAHKELVTLPDDALPLSLSSALKRLERDLIYEQSIKLITEWI